jgi:hypothetical protein
MGVPALRTENLFLSVASGAVFGFLGPNGAGKSGTETYGATPCCAWFANTCRRGGSRWRPLTLHRNGGT